jgi:hypothetical protein
MEPIDNIGKQVGTLSFASKIKDLIIPIPFIIVLIILYSFVFSPTKREVERLRASIAQKERQRNSTLQTIDGDNISTTERGIWDEIDARISTKLLPYDPLDVMKELTYIAHSAGVDEVMDVSATTDRAVKMGTSLEYYTAEISFYMGRYDAFLDFFRMMEELNPLVDIESVNLNKESRGVLVRFKLRVYRTGGANAQEK